MGKRKKLISKIIKTIKTILMTQKFKKGSALAIYNRRQSGSLSVDFEISSSTEYANTVK